MIFQFKKQLFLFKMVLFIFLGLFFIVNNSHAMPMNNPNNTLNDVNSINNKICELYLERKDLATKISSFLKYDTDITQLKKQLYNLDQKIKNLYQRISIINTLTEINKQIWQLSYERNQIAIKLISHLYQEPIKRKLYD